MGNLGPLQSDLTSFIGAIQTLLEGLGLAVGVIGIIVGGLMRATAFGDERRIARSNQAIICAVVGLAIVGVAFVAGQSIQSFFKQ